MRPPQPQIRDVIGIVEFVRHHWSVDYPAEGLPAEFAGWRASIRAEAKRIGMRVSVRRAYDVVIVLNPEYRPTKAQLRAAVEGVAELTDTVDQDRSKVLPTERHLRVVPR